MTVDMILSIGKLDVVNTCAEDGASPLFLAAQEGHVDCVKLLLQNGADANLVTNDPIALPLHAALQFNHIEYVFLSQHHGMDVLVNLSTANKFPSATIDICHMQCVG